MTSSKKVFYQLHLWLGLVSGLVVFIIAITGCCWVFKEEIKALTQDEIIIEHQSGSIITPSKAKKIGHELYRNKLIHGVLFDDPTKPVELIFYQAEPLFYRSAFLNPFSGEVLKTEDHLSGFFAFVLDGHLNLWLPEAFGNQIVRWGSVVFAFMLISGIILWWPKKKNNRKQRFSFRWKDTTKWKRKNYDLHAIVGFYSSILALTIVLTGLIMAFPTVKDAIYYGLGGEKQATFLIPEGSTLNKDLAVKPIDNLLPQLEKLFPEARDFEIHYPHSDSSAIYVEVSNTDGVFYNSGFLYFDQNTLTEIPSTTFYGKYNEAKLPDKLLRMNYDTHIGAIFGLPGKILVFLISLTVASLPVTGILMWYGRNFKKKKRNKKVEKRELAGVV